MARSVCSRGAVGDSGDRTGGRKSQGGAGGCARVSSNAGGTGRTTFGVVEEEAEKSDCAGRWQQSGRSATSIELGRRRQQHRQSRSMACAQDMQQQQQRLHRQQHMRSRRTRVGVHASTTARLHQQQQRLHRQQQQHSNSSTRGKEAVGPCGGRTTATQQQQQRLHRQQQQRSGRARKVNMPASIVAPTIQQQ